MANKHSAQTVDTGIHIPYAYSYANTAARTGASGFVAGDVGKFARQTDNNTVWMLTATTPTWKQIGLDLGSAAVTAAYILVADGSDYVGVALSGDGTITSAGVLSITDLTIASEARGDILRRGASSWERHAAKTSGQILVGDGTDIVSVAVSGDSTLAANGALTAAATQNNITSIPNLATIGTVTSGTLSAGAVLAGVTMTIGSDADGDIYYRASNVLTRLAKGTAYQNLRMNSGATAPEWSDQLVKEIDFPAGGFLLPTSNYAPLDMDTGTNGTIWRHLFDDTTEEFVEGAFQVPKDIDTAGTVTFEAYGYSSTAAASKNIELKIYHSAKSDSESWDAAYSSKESGDLAVDGTQDDLDYLTWTETVSNLGWAASDHVRMKLSRIDASANDLTGDWGLTHFRIRIPRV